MNDTSMNKLLAPLVPLALAAGLSFAAAPAVAAPASYSLAQGNFTGGGQLLGTFTGEDLDANLRLSLNELTAFSLTFAGDSQVPDLSLGLGDLDVFFFDLGGSVLGDGVGEGLSTPDVAFTSGWAVQGTLLTLVLHPDPQSQAFSESRTGISVRASTTGSAAAPATWALLPLALCALMPGRRRLQAGLSGSAGSTASPTALPKQSLKVNSSET